MAVVVMAMMIIVAMVCIRVLVVTLFTVEHEEVHAERIERRHKHACQHSKVRKACTGQGLSATASMMLSLE